MGEVSVVGTIGCGGARRVYVFADDHDTALAAAREWVKENVLADVALRARGMVDGYCSGMAPTREACGQTAYSWDIVPVKPSIGRQCGVGDV